MKLLAIETSCDETAIALIEVKKPTRNTSAGKEGSKVKFKILGNEISSQIEIHKEYGGVFPALAKREHIKNLPLVLDKVLKQSKIKEKDLKKINAITVTTGPGLEPALWTGIVFAKELSQKYNIPIIPVNHMEGHIFSIFPKKGKTFVVENKKELFPMLTLLVSGGHTELVLIKDWQKYKKLGQTRDDAAGEAFDKVARMLSLPYPGGPEISRLAEKEREYLIPLLRGGLKSKGGCIPPPPSGTPQEENFTFPRPMIYSKDYDFSFSGLKTSVLYLIRDLKEKNSNILNNINIKQKIAREFEDAVVETLVHKTIKAIKQYKIQTLIVGGGVSANTYLQEQMKKAIKEINFSSPTTKKIKVHFPSKALTGDNAIMIGIAGYFRIKNKNNIKNTKNIKADGNLSL